MLTWLPMLRVGVFILCAVPAALLSERLLTGGLGANPVEALLHGTGSWGLRLLLVTLAITPLRHITGANWLVRLRRQIGLWAFAYAAAHFLIFIVFEHRAVLSSIVEDIIARPYILIGTSAFLLLMPLAITSTKGWIRRLGKRWQRLHWLIYPAAVLGVVHFFMLIRANRWTEPLIYAAVLVLLLGFRVLRRWRVG